MFGSVDVRYQAWDGDTFRGVRVADKTMTLRLPEAQAEALNTMAEILEVPVVEVVRLAISEFIDHRRREPSFQKRLRDSMERVTRAMDNLSWPDRGEPGTP
jgi:hypothetical protein